MGPAKGTYRNCSINSQSVIHARLVDLQCLAGLLLVLLVTAQEMRGSHLEEGCRKGRRAARRKVLSTACWFWLG